MMKRKCFLLLFIVFFFGRNVYGQQSVDKATDGITRFFTWIRSLDDVIFAIDNKEQLNALHRHLGYASFYIDEIAREKLMLAVQVKQLRADLNKSHLPGIRERVKKVFEAMRDLNAHLRSIQRLVSQTNQKEIADIIKEIDAGFNIRKQHFMTDLQNSIEQKNVPYDRVLKDAEESKKIADEAVKEIRVAKEKIMVALGK